MDIYGFIWTCMDLWDIWIYFMGVINQLISGGVPACRCFPLWDSKKIKWRTNRPVWMFSKWEALHSNFTSAIFYNLKQVSISRKMVAIWFVQLAFSSLVTLHSYVKWPIILPVKNGAVPCRFQESCWLLGGSHQFSMSNLCAQKKRMVLDTDKWVCLTVG